MGNDAKMQAEGRGYLVEVVLCQVSKLPGGRHAQGGVKQAPLAEGEQVIEPGLVWGLPSNLPKRHRSLHAHPACQVQGSRLFCNQLSACITKAAWSYVLEAYDMDIHLSLIDVVLVACQIPP